MSESIFGSLATKRSQSSWTDLDNIGQASASIAKPEPTIEATQRPPVSIRAGKRIGDEVALPREACTPIEMRDAALIAILDTPLQPGETAHAGFARKERELGNAFAELSVMEARSLQSRLSNPRAGDALAQAFSRMTSERRARLINFLADARRREALKKG